MEALTCSLLGKAFSLIVTAIALLTSMFHQGLIRWEEQPKVISDSVFDKCGVGFDGINHAGCRYGYGGSGMMVQRGDGGFGTVLLFLMAAGALVWFIQGQSNAGGMSLGETKIRGTHFR